MITSIRSPLYSNMYDNWAKYRYTYQAGDTFKNIYLYPLSTREKPEDFDWRKKNTYPCASGANAVKEVIAGFSQRILKVRREVNSITYNNCIEGKAGGVDYSGNTLQTYLNKYVLPELLAMGRVGIFIDQHSDIGGTMYEQKNKHPYLYYYQTECILAWRYANNSTLDTLLLQAAVPTYDDVTGLTNGETQEYRLYQVNEVGLVVTKYEIVEENNVKVERIKSTTLIEGLYEVPFVIVDIGQSLLTNVCDRQIALMNLQSTDMSYLLNANFPLYTESYKPGEQNFGQKPQPAKIGTTTGKRYVEGTDRPAFIHPSPEPLLASLKKQEQIEDEIRELVSLNISTLQGKHASAESKAKDQEPLEAGLTVIAAELERAELAVANFWCYFCGEDSTNNLIKYPENMCLKSRSELRAEAKECTDLARQMTSLTAKKELQKEAGQYLYTPEQYKLIMKEIEDAKYVETDPINIEKDVASGLVDSATASQARGYAPELASKAAEEHMTKMKAIYEAQTSLKQRGLTDTKTPDGNLNNKGSE